MATTRRKNRSFPGRRYACLALLLALTATLAPAALASDEPRPAALERLDDYTGLWRSEDKAGPDGGTFHFELELRWYDPGKTIAKLDIRQVLATETKVLFQGFKGRDPDGGVYYVAASPSGRAARGEVTVEDTDLVTAYDGWDPAATKVEVRDLFAPVEDGAFVSRTLLRRSTGEEWRQVNEDHWKRIDT